MPQDIRIWKVFGGDQLHELPAAELDVESRIENWLAQDISIISNDLMVIGRQVKTEYGGVIDLLCLDRNGDTVIVELKRDKTPRDITAQVLDYASWVEHLSHDQISEIADRHLGAPGSLDSAFEERFGDDSPETLNGQHRMLIIASKIDPSTERIINYLSNTHGVDINAVSFQFFRDQDKQEFLARVFLMDPSQVEDSGGRRSKRGPNLTFEQLEQLAKDNGVGELYKELAGKLRGCFDYVRRTRSTLAFTGRLERGRRWMLSLVPGSSSAEQGVRFTVYVDRLAEYLGVSKGDLKPIWPAAVEDYEPYKGASPAIAGYFKTSDEVERFCSGLQGLRT